MTQIVQAVFENGVLRPVEPLRLEENERVEVTVRPLDDHRRETDGNGWACLPEMEPTDAGRKAALARLFREIDAMNLHVPHPFPSRDELHERR